MERIEINVDDNEEMVAVHHEAGTGQVILRTTRYEGWDLVQFLSRVQGRVMDHYRTNGSRWQR